MSSKEEDLEGDYIKNKIRSEETGQKASANKENRTKKTGYDTAHNKKKFKRSAVNRRV